MRTSPLLFPLLLGAICVTNAQAQPPDQHAVLDTLDRKGCVVLQSSQVKICRYDFVATGDTTEAISFRPAGDGKFPAILLIPGYQGTARDYVPLGSAFAGAGFACVAITPPGVGRSQGKPDFVGPNTIKALTDGFNRFARESFVDSTRMGVFGYSLGAMAASLLAVRLPDIRAAVFGAGIYDFRKAYDEIRDAAIRKSMKAETGMTPGAVRERSSILEMQNLKCPVLILHGEDDPNAPVSQALLLRDRLDELKKDYDIRLLRGKDHGLDMREVQVASLDFFKRTLMNVPGK